MSPHAVYCCSTVIRQAFRLWEQASGGALYLLDRSNGTEPVDIDIFFATFDHGDHEPFDGTGGIVAHTGYPTEGKIHFDGNEIWTLNSDTGVDFRYVALHEVGHALGLRHSKSKNSIMFPVYRHTRDQDDEFNSLGLFADDIRGIRHLYPITRRARPTLADENNYRLMR